MPKTPSLNDTARMVIQRVAGQLTNKEYVAKGRNECVCPYCQQEGSLSFCDDDEIEQGGVCSCNTFFITFTTACSSCGKQWTDVFQLAGYIEGHEKVDKILPATIQELEKNEADQ